MRNVGGNLIWLGKEQHETKSLEICGGITDISTRLESSAHSRYAYMSEVLLFSIGGRRVPYSLRKTSGEAHAFLEGRVVTLSACSRCERRRQV